MTGSGNSRSTASGDDKAARQRVRGMLIVVFGLVLAGLGLFIAPWGLVGNDVVNGYDISRAVAADAAAISGLTRVYLSSLMLFLPFALGALTLTIAFVRGAIPAVRWTLSAVCVGSALLHALSVRDAFANSAGYGTWMVGAGYLVLGYGGVVVFRAASAARNIGTSESRGPAG